MTLPLEIAYQPGDPLRHYCKCGDTGPTIRRKLTDAETGLPVDLTGATALFVIADTDGEYLFASAATVESPTTGGIVSYVPTAEETATAGTYLAEFAVTLQSGAEVTFPPANEDSDRNYIRLVVVDRLPQEAPAP